jgi:hypothetical protein
VTAFVVVCSEILLEGFLAGRWDEKPQAHRDHRCSFFFCRTAETIAEEPNLSNAVFLLFDEEINAVAVEPEGED